MKTTRADVIAPDVREVIREFSPDAPMYRIFTMEGLAARTMSDLSFTMLTLGIAAGLALVLGAVGLYGVLSYVVAQRTREIGIRMALGAQARQLRRMVVAQGGRVALIGVVIGIVGAVLATRVLDTLLFGVRPMDVVTFTAMSALMLAVALIASYIPARRASAVDPMRSLRTDSTAALQRRAPRRGRAAGCRSAGGASSGGPTGDPSRPCHPAGAGTHTRRITRFAARRDH
jgi:ABC-type antimicrobial peptide transport system permease subunit